MATNKVECPACDADLKIEDLIVIDDFHICPNCEFQGWIGDFTIEKSIDD